MVRTRASNRSSSTEPESPPQSPSKTRSSRNGKGSASSTPSKAVTKSAKQVAANSSSLGWSHAPNTVVLFWMVVSLPLVIWDTGYILGRPHTMPGGAWHWPIWTPYKLYGEIDHVYGFKAFNSKLGFTAAQGTMNILETVMYFAYVYLYFSRGKVAEGGMVGAKRRIDGRVGAFTCLLGFSAALLTLGKTFLYALHEHYTGYDNTSHNDLMTLIFLYVIPNGSWIVFPTYMIYSLGNDILDGLTEASATVHVKAD